MASNPFEVLEKTSSAPSKDKKKPSDLYMGLEVSSGKYTVEPPRRPYLYFRPGYAAWPKKEPSAEERAEYLYYRAGSVLGRALPGYGHLKDALPAFNHYLSGNGADRVIDNYIDFIKEDRAGKVALGSIQRDFVKHVELLGQNREVFVVSSLPYYVGDHHQPRDFPYPETENWQKTLGGHYLWVSAEVEIGFSKARGVDEYKARVTLHVEDVYNFNNGNVDIKSGVPDHKFGRFEVWGLANEYKNFATLTFDLTWFEGVPHSVKSSLDAHLRGRGD